MWSWGAAGPLAPARARLVRRWLTVSTVLMAGLMMGSGVAHAATFVVSNTADSGAGSLRDAITNANTTTGPNTIDFAIAGSGVQTIAPASALPPITNPVVIDGTSQHGYKGVPLIRLDGSDSPATGATGLVVTAGSSTVRGLQITDWRTGIECSGAAGNVVAGNYIGNDGTNPLGNATGVLVDNGSTANTIGGTTAAARNVVSGNSGYAIAVLGSSGNLIEGNYIGTDATGSHPLANGTAGVDIAGGATGNTVGGLVAAARNVISGYGGDLGAAGVMISDGGTNQNVVEGDAIGTNAARTATMGPSTADGVLITNGASDNTVGSTSSGGRNVISGNQYGVELDGSANTTTANTIEGNYIGTNGAGTAALPNSVSGVRITAGADQNTIGGTTSGARNVISGNYHDGIDLAGGTDNSVEGNYIGTIATGKAALPNGADGVQLDGDTGTTVGGTTSGTRNVLSGNGNDGVEIDGVAGARVEGNYIGTSSSGAAGVGNGNDGVLVSGAIDTVIGPRNVVSGNTVDGISVQDASDIFLEGNAIGVNAARTAALANGGDGVDVNGAQTMGIGDTARNLISGNAQNGIAVGGATTGMSIEDNFIGTTSNGGAPLGNTEDGILIDGGTQGTTIGDGSKATSNLISGNGKDGVVISDSGTSNNQLLGNYIGTGAGGSGQVPNLGNADVLVENGATNNQIGIEGGPPGDSNKIAYGVNGVQVDGAGSTGDSINGNSIFDVSGAGIALTGGANNNQAAPTNVEAVTSGGFTTISGTVLPGSQDVEVFSNEGCATDPWGKKILGSARTTNGTWSFTTKALPSGVGVTETATDASGDTSEFATCVTAP